MKASILVFSILGLLVGCGGDGGGGNGGSGGSGGGPTMTSSSSKVEQVNGACVMNPQVLTGSTGKGGSCSDYTACKPTCCQCGNGKNNSWLGAECTNGACADPCADTVSSADCSM